MFWLFFALLEPALHGIANIFDNFLTNKVFPNTVTLILYATYLNVLFLPLVWLFQFPSAPTLSQIPFFILLGLLEMGYLYPYYKALQHDDTSIVISLFSLGKIFVPILAFLLVAEVLTLVQYAGFVIIIVSGALLTLNKAKKIHFNKSFMYMGICSFILALDVVVYKYIFEQVSWSTGFTWATLCPLLFTLPLLLVKPIRRDVLSQFHRFRKHAHLFVMEEFLTFAGSASMTFAISLASVSLVGAIGSVQPFFVLVYALLLGRYFPKAFKENVTKRSILKKMILFLVMVAGVMMVVG